MISSKLASAITGKDVKKCSILNKGTNSVNITYYPHEDMNYTDWKPYNIYQLINECKIWLLNEGISFDVRYHKNKKPLSISIMTYGLDSKFFVGKTEVEAVIKLGEYTIKQKEQNGKDKQLQEVLRDTKDCR